MASVFLVRPDGYRVLATTCDCSSTKTAGTGHHQLSDDQLYAIVADPHWGPGMDAAFVAEAANTIQLRSRPL